MQNQCEFREEFALFWWFMLTHQMLRNFGVILILTSDLLEELDILRYVLEWLIICFLS